MKRIVLSLLLILTLGTPAVILAQAPPVDYSGFVKCDGVIKPGEESRKQECGFAMFIKTIKLAINWMFIISIPVATALFAFAGLLYMSGEPGKKSQARGIFTTVATGFIIMCVAWMGVRQFVTWFVDEPTATTFLGK